MDWIELSGKCKLLTYTNVHFAPTSFRDEAPYVLALVELEEGGKAFASMSKSIPTSQIRIGMDLRLVAVRYPGGRVGYEVAKA